LRIVTAPVSAGGALLPDQLAERLYQACLGAAAAGGEVLLADADSYGGAIAHANIQEHHRNPLIAQADSSPRVGAGHESAHTVQMTY
jgi:hypothetical protein